MIQKGNLITLALQGEFDVIAHGCNCFCVMGAGIAPQMAKAFGCDTFNFEQSKYMGWINKLGNIDFEGINLSTGDHIRGLSRLDDVFSKGADLIVVNCYTQFGFGNNHTGGTDTPLDYTALTLCLKKMNHIFKGKHIGLPWIGCGLAGGDMSIVRKLIEVHLKDCKVTIVEYDKT